MYQIKYYHKGQNQTRIGFLSDPVKTLAFFAEIKLQRLERYTMDMQGITIKCWDHAGMLELSEITYTDAKNIVGDIYLENAAGNYTRQLFEWDEVSKMLEK